MRALADAQADSALLARLSSVALDAELPTIKALTVHAAVFTLRLVRRALDLVAASTKDDVPLLGSRDTHIVGMLVAILARWGLAACVEPGVLPDSMRDDLLGVKPSQGKLEELPDVKVLDLEQLTRDTITLGAPTDGPSTSTAVQNPLPQLIASRTDLCVIAALLQLKHDGQRASEWAAKELTRMLQRCGYIYGREAVH
jgi:hypothetical protein